MTLTFTPPTARAVPEWIGANADTPVPPRVRVRVFDRKHGRCHICERSIRAGEKWTLEHLIALINWRATTEQPHGNRESNLTVTCDWCLPEKNAADVAQKSKAYATRAVIVFVASERRIRFDLPLPTGDSDKDEKAKRQKWRALLLCIKAKLEGVESKIETFEEAFLAHVVLPDGLTMLQHAKPAIEQAYKSGDMPPLLPGPKK